MMNTMRRMTLECVVATFNMQDAEAQPSACCAVRGQLETRCETTEGQWSASMSCSLSALSPTIKEAREYPDHQDTRPVGV